MALNLSITFDNGAVAEYHKISRVEANPKHGLVIYVQHYRDSTYRESGAPCVAEDVEQFTWDEWQSTYSGNFASGLYGLLKQRDTYSTAEDIIESSSTDSVTS